jgi:hypothetical protein
MNTRTYQTAHGEITLSIAIDDDLIEAIKRATPEEQPPEEFLEWLHKQRLVQKR